MVGPLVAGALVAGGLGGPAISPCTLQLFASQHFAMQEEIVIDDEGNLLCASKQMRSCVVVQL